MDDAFREPALQFMIKRNHTESGRIYFCTFTCLNWLYLFHIANAYDEVYKWFKVLQQYENEIAGFVIMPNHVHVLVYIKNEQQSINTLLANGKRFMAYEIIKRLEKMGDVGTLAILEKAVTHAERMRNKKHRVFEISSDIKACYTEKFIEQKLNYIHYNLLQEKWKLATLPEPGFIQVLLIT
ncbi:hypothetical protein BH10BAC2_BH10BAC2_16450 [soil metagenome]